MHAIHLVIISTTINVHVEYIVHQLTTLRNFQHSNDDNTIHVKNLEVSIYKIRPLLIIETSIYTWFWYKFTD